MRWHLLVLEALFRLALARLLIGTLLFGRWRKWLGPIAAAPLDTPPPTAADRQLSRAVERASQRLPFETKCLPRAMALHWMLRQRRRPSELVIAVLPGIARGALDDLHAWVEAGGEVLIGATSLAYRSLARFGGCMPAHTIQKPADEG